MGVWASGSCHITVRRELRDDERGPLVNNCGRGRRSGLLTGWHSGLLQIKLRGATGRAGEYRELHRTSGSWATRWSWAKRGKGEGGKEELLLFFKRGQTYEFKCKFESFEFYQ
jgi:hypothetical protein